GRRHETPLRLRARRDAATVPARRSAPAAVDRRRLPDPPSLRPRRRASRSLADRLAVRTPPATFAVRAEGDGGAGDAPDRGLRLRCEDAAAGRRPRTEWSAAEGEGRSP